VGTGDRTMTGPEHYREAERALDSLPTMLEKFQRANASVAEQHAAAAVVSFHVAVAQVHATLAMTAVWVDTWQDRQYLRWDEAVHS
jgi:hypothetical protein